MVKSKPKKKNVEMAVYDADYNAIIDLAAQHRSKKNQFSFCDQLKSLKESELTKLMKQLLKILMEYIEKNLDQGAAVDWTSLNPEECKMIGQFIQAATDIGLACIHCDFTSICHLELVQIAVFLHGIMLSMPDNMDYVKNCIAHYCEKLFSTGLLENGEIFLSNVVLYLVRKTLAKRAAKTDVKRLYSIRKIFKNVMEADGPNTALLWPLLSECAVSQTYLSILEGQKVIALILTLDSDKLLEIHEKIKKYVPGVSIKTAIAYGKVYFEAWCYTVKSGNKEMRDVVEITCLQEFILMGIHCKHKHILPIIRKILNQFFIHKKEPEVSKMLYGMYQPLIWRYLKNPNGLYRACAAQLFLDIFPLEDPDSRVVKNDIELTEQLLMIRELLLDDFPIVRITTVLGICVSMSVNWEVFPEEMLKTFFRIIVNDLSRDSATSEVRVAVVKGLKCLLENPLTVRTLVGVLPKLQGLFHDISENVRIAFCQLLLKVKKISAIKYFDIVPVHHLLARMEEDCHAVKKCLANLIHNSYFPKNQDPKVWVGRSLEILKTAKMASRVFFTYVSNFIGFQPAVQFMIRAARAIYFYVQTKSSPCRMDMEISDKENIQSFTDYINSLEDAVGFSNLNIVGSVMEAIAVMWLSLRLQPNHVEDEGKTWMKMLVSKLGKPLMELCLYYKDTVAWEPVFFLSSFIPPSLVPNFACLIFGKLKNLQPDAQEPHYMALLQCIVNQGRASDLLKLLKEWIEAGLSSSYVSLPPAKKRRGRKKNYEAIYQDQIHPYLANRILNTMLNQRNLQKQALLEQTDLQDIVYLAERIMNKLERVDARLISEAEADFFNLLIFNIVRLSVHLHNHPDYDRNASVPFLNDFVKWTDETLVKHIAPVAGERNHFTSLVFRICENLCKILGDVTALGFYEPDDCLYLEFIYKLLGTDYGHEFLLLASKFLYKHAATSQHFILLCDDATMMQHNLSFLNKVVVFINNEAMLEKISLKDLEDITFILANVMQIVQNHVNKLTESTSQVFKTILKNILDCTAVKCSDVVEEMTEDPFDRLSFPKAGNFFWSIVSLKPKLNRTYVKYLIDIFKDSEDINISVWMSYWMITWSFLHSKSLTQPVVKEINSLVLELEKCLHSLYPRAKNSDQSNSQEPTEPVALQLFQRHCHAELIKLKNRVKSKLRVK